MEGGQWGAGEARGDGAEDMGALSAITGRSSTRTGTEDGRGGTKGARAVAVERSQDTEGKRHARGEFGSAIETKAKWLVAESAGLESDAAEKDEPVVDGVRAAWRDEGVRRKFVDRFEMVSCSVGG